MESPQLVNDEEPKAQQGKALVEQLGRNSEAIATGMSKLLYYLWTKLERDKEETKNELGSS